MFLYALDILGTAVFAITGVLVACRKDMDLFGVMVLAFVTAVGGGTIRDMLLGGDPVFWVTDTNYLFIILGSVAAGLLTRKLCLLFNNTLLIMDAIGLATFTIIGVEKTLSLGAAPLVAIIMGALTGAGGGVIRDLLAGDVPLVLKQGIYPTAAIAGGLAYVILNMFALPMEWVALSASVIVLVLRLAAIEQNLTLPSWRIPD
ncbi:trimeric intracellular cation channel family protein [Endozoicomonas sp. Mp262]|uniref:trimeric intracellular cation channel family protein n=1 Tax=Endozoicomonas sp. Mp262 TaxID=2919499 RepID=UPI0021D8F29A